MATQYDAHTSVGFPHSRNSNPASTALAVQGDTPRAGRFLHAMPLLIESTVSTREALHKPVFAALHFSLSESHSQQPTVSHACFSSISGAEPEPLENGLQAVHAEQDVFNS
jgi:hypothetical protein